MQRQRLTVLPRMVNCEDCNHHDHPAEGLPEDKAEMHRGKQDSENSKETVTTVMTEGIQPKLTLNSSYLHMLQS